MSANERVNSELAIEQARPIAEKYRDALAVALASTPGHEWRSVDLQVSLLTGTIAWAIDDATLVEKERCAQKADAEAERHRLNYEHNGKQPLDLYYETAAVNVAAAIRA